MEKILGVLQENSERLIAQCTSTYRRYFASQLDEAPRMLGIVGARGVGKTTAIL